MNKLTINIYFLGPPKTYESDRSYRDEKARLSSTITTPESFGAKSPSLDSAGEESVSDKKYRKPIGGVAVLPPMEMKRIEEQRKSPLDRERKSPVDRKSAKSPAAIPENDVKRDLNFIEEVSFISFIIKMICGDVLVDFDFDACFLNFDFYFMLHETFLM